MVVSLFFLVGCFLDPFEWVPHMSDSSFFLREHCSPFARLALHRIWSGTSVLTRVLFWKSSDVTVACSMS